MFECPLSIVHFAESCARPHRLTAALIEQFYANRTVNQGSSVHLELDAAVSSARWSGPATDGRDVTIRPFFLASQCTRTRFT